MVAGGRSNAKTSGEKRRGAHPGGVPDLLEFSWRVDLFIPLASLRDATFIPRQFRRSSLRGDLRLPSGNPPGWNYHGWINRKNTLP